MTKVDGTKNPADMLAKNLSAREMQGYMQALGIHRAEGRAAAMANLHPCSKPPFKNRARDAVMRGGKCIPQLAPEMGGRAGAKGEYGSDGTTPPGGPSSLQ